MALVRHLESSPWPVYNGGSRCKNFVQGEERECSEELASYLCDTFPGYFELVKPKKAKAAAPKAPAKNRAMKEPVKRTRKKAVKK
tara:strand:- start:253 stop:507 length:255 start_codon:yes stop_codon:yes gene_type:complete